MQATHVDALERAIQKTNEWLKAIQKELRSDRAGAYVALRATLHALRDRLLPSEAVHLGAQLPALVRGIYYEGWRLTDKPVRLRTRDEFFASVRAHSGDGGLDAEQSVRAVFHVLAEHVTRGELEDVLAELPSALRVLWPEQGALEAGPRG